MKLEKGTNPTYWVKKIETNMARDQRHNIQLKDSGWTVLRLWESDILANPDYVAKAVKAVVRAAGL